MDNKRLILAIVLSVVTFVSWNYISLKMGWVIPPEQVAQVNGSVNNAVPAPIASGTAGDLLDPSVPSSSVVPGSVVAPVALTGELVTIETPLYTAVLSSQGGILRSFDLLAYRLNVADKKSHMPIVSKKAAEQGSLGVFVEGIPTWTTGTWRVEGASTTIAAGQSTTLRFVGELSGFQVMRELTFSGSTYTIDEKLSVIPSERRPISAAFTFNISSLALLDSPTILQRIWHSITGGPALVAGESQHNMTRIGWLQNGSVDEELSPESLKGKEQRGMTLGNNVSWIAAMNNYFMGAISTSDTESIAKANYVNDVYEVVLGRTSLVGAPDSPAIMNCTYYLGPKEVKALAAAPNQLDKSLDYGFVSILAKPLVYMLQFFYGFVGNYGYAIILMTIVIKLVLWPISQKGYRSMEQMRSIQPLMAEVREKYKDDKEAMNKEMMALYKRYKVNPAGGCLPILVQLPVFFALYRVLLNAIELRHAEFISFLPFTDMPWLTDLAAQDPYMITPLVMGASMLIQQRMTPAPGDPTQAKIMMLMPIIFTLLFISFPSGLVLYWLTNNIISIGQQWWQMRRNAR